MRIGIDGRRSSGSGIGRVTSNLIDGLVALDDRHEYVVLARSYQDRREGNVTVRVVDAPFFSARDLYEIPEVINRQNLDVFISPQFYISPFIECPTIKLVHDLWPLLFREWVPRQEDFLAHFGQESASGIRTFLEAFGELYERGLILPENEFLKRELGRADLKETERYLTAMMAATLGSAQRIVVPSAHTMDEISTYFPEVLPRLEVVPNFASPVFSPDATVVKQPYLLHVAKWEPRKNIEVLLQAGRIVFSSLQMKLVLIGDQGYRDYGRGICQMIANPPYSNFVCHKGIVADAILRKCYQQAFAFVFPSLYEGFGIPPLEAMACGTPVVTSNTTALPEVCGQAALFVDPTNPREIASAIERLAGEPALYESLVRRGVERALQLSPSAALKKLMDIIIEVGRTDVAPNE